MSKLSSTKLSSFAKAFALLVVFFTVTAANTQELRKPKQINLGSESAGDCKLLYATFTFYPNGLGLFETTTLTTHTHNGDVWHVNATVTSPGGTALVHLGQWDGPRMSDGGPRYPWKASFTFDPSIWNDITNVSMHSSC